MILRQSLVPVGMGVIAGVGGAVMSGPLLQHLFVGAKALSVQACIIASVLLLVTAMIAAWYATARILAIDPIDAIRAE